MPKHIELKPIKPNVSIGLNYQSKLIKLLKQLNDAISKEINATYSAVAMDSNPVTQFSFAIKRVFAKYNKRFKKIADIYANAFVEDVSRDTRRQLMESTKDLITIKPDRDYIGIINTKKALINENVNLINDLPEKMYKDIYGDMMRSLAKGGNQQEIVQGLIKNGLPPLKEIHGDIKLRQQQVLKRARFIARDQTFKANGMINNARMANNGITKAVWRHSGGDKQPRPSHLAADGKVFETAKGCLIDGEYIIVGQLIGCTCFQTPVIEFD